jgi:hypothetical protein
MEVLPIPHAKIQAATFFAQIATTTGLEDKVIQQAHKNLQKIMDSLDVDTKKLLESYSTLKL